MNIKENKITLAIVTTVYNDNLFLPKLLKSLFNQTDSSFTHYIYDDGSNEPPDYLIEEYINKINTFNKNIKVIYLKGDKNIGVNKAHEYVFKKINEEYFSWVDSDDWVDKNFIKIVKKNIIKRNNIDVFHINSKKFNEKYRVVDKSSASHLSRVARRSRDQFPYFSLDGFYFYHNFFVKTSSFKEINNDCYIFEANKEKPFWYDAQIMFELSVSHKNFYLIKRPLSNILERKTSVSRQNDRFLDKYNTYKEISMIFDKMNISQSDKELFYCLLPFSKERVKVYDMFLKGDIKEAKKMNKVHYNYVKENHYPLNYFILKEECRFLLLRHRLSFLFKIRRKLLSFIHH